MFRPKASCLINHYNYGAYIERAIDSALGQQIPFDEIIIVDDGSTDGSLEVVERVVARHPQLRLITQPNAGQLSCFNRAYRASTGDLLFFLDADDVYEEHYTREVFRAYSESAADFVFCGYRTFGNSQTVVLPWPEDIDFGYSVIYTLECKRWLGTPTSCLSMRRSVADKILPLPLEEDWRTRADDCLVFGASLVGARKHYLAQPLVRYRVHDRNAYFGKPYHRERDFLRKLAINRLFGHVLRRMGYDRERLAALAHREFRTLPHPSFKELRRREPTPPVR